MYRIQIYSVFVLIMFFSSACIEEIDFKTEDFESVLVIDATITNENKIQEIILSRSFAFEEEGPAPEENATITIKTNQEEIVFSETEPGKYLSRNAFAAQANIDYQLKITTNNGKSYSSSIMQMPQVSPLESLYAERENNNGGVNGMSIFVDSYDPNGSSKFYRYEYEETYKIIAPKWKDKDLIITNDQYPWCEVELIPRSLDEKVCYNTELSNKIIQTNTTGLNEDRVSRFLVRQIASNNYILTWRYSILVKQYVQSGEAYRYFESLANFSTNESLFSQIQTGFFEGNIISETNPEEKIIGFFDLSTVSLERIFFNYEDFYPNEPKPPFLTFCFEWAPVRIQEHPLDRCGPLLDGITQNQIKYFKVNENAIIHREGPYIVVARFCGDCTAIGETAAPDFWVE